MKSKKLVCAILALTLAVGLIAGATGCSCSGGTSRAKGVKGSEITQEQWDTFFGISGDDASSANGGQGDRTILINTYTETQSYSEGVLVIAKEYSETEIVIDGDNDYVISTRRTEGKIGEIDVKDEDPETIVYSEKTEVGGSTLYYRYTLNANDEWERDFASYSEGQSRYDDMVDTLLGSSDSLDFDNYVYSSDRRGYVRKDDLKGEEPVVKFNDDGKLVAVWAEMDDYIDTTKIVATYDVTIEYDDNTIELPDEFTDNTVSTT